MFSFSTVMKPLYNALKLVLILEFSSEYPEICMNEEVFLSSYIDIMYLLIAQITIEYSKA